MERRTWGKLRQLSPPLARRGFEKHALGGEERTLHVDC